MAALGHLDTVIFSWPLYTFVAHLIFEVQIKSTVVPDILSGRGAQNAVNIFPS